MSINAFKKMVIVSCFAVMAINVNAQDREEEHSLVSTGLCVHAPDVKIDENAREDGYDSGLASVALDQLVTKPLKGLLSTAEAFGKFAYQHPVAAFTVTAAYALPVVAALLPEQSPWQWYPSFICAKVADTQLITYSVNSTTVTNRFVRSDGGYVFPPYYGSHGYVAEADCSYDTWSRWLYTASPQITYPDGTCRCCASGTAYAWAQPQYTMGFDASSATTNTIRATCVLATSAP